MKLDYSHLISPYPYRLVLEVNHNPIVIGGIKSPTLKEIWNPEITYNGYQMFIGLLFMNPQKYCEQIKPEKLNWFNSLNEDEQSRLSMMQFIKDDIMLQHSYEGLFNFFFDETVFWDSANEVFFTMGYNVFYDKDKQVFYTLSEDGEKVATNNFGYITEGIWTLVCDIILQRCGVNISDTETDLSRVKSKKARDIIKKLRLGKKKTNENNSMSKDDELPNLISAISVKSNSINFLNVWDLTVYQFYEHFKREQSNVFFGINSTRVAAYGNEDKTFKGNEWYKTGN